MPTDCFPYATSEWPKGPISELAEINPRYQLIKGYQYPFIEMAAVVENFGGIQEIGFRRLEGSGLSKFQVGDTLFAKITPCPENGKVAYVADLPAEFGIGSTEFIVLSPNENCDPKFLFYLLCCHEVRGRAVARMEGSTGRQRVPDDVFNKRLIVPLPPPEEQAAIAHILDTVDTAIAQTREVVEQAILLRNSLIGDFFEQQKHNRNKLSEFITEIRYGTSQAAHEKGWGKPTLRIPNVVGDEISYDDLVYVDVKPSDVARYRLEEGDLLLVRSNGNPNYVGRSAVFKAPDPNDWLFASYLIRVRFKDELSSDYVNVFLGSQQGRRELLRRVTTSAGNNNINATNIRLIPIPVPKSLDDQQQIVALANTSLKQVNALRSKQVVLEQLKASLMHDLLTGKVRANKLDADFISRKVP